MGLLMWKWINIMMIAMLVPSLALAEPVLTSGAFTRLKKGETIQFDAWCYDDLANAQILAELGLLKDKCQLITGRALQLQAERYNLEIDNLKHRLRTEVLTSTEALLARDAQIQALEKAALKSPNDYSLWWASGGFTVGVLLSIGIIYAVR